MALAIIDVMGQLNPHLRDVEDFKHKLMGSSAHVMSDFKIEVDSPYPIPKPEEGLSEKPGKLEYPSK